MPNRNGFSAIDKHPVDGPVRVHALGLAGDAQYERRYHGGPAQAIHLYAREDLIWWSEQLSIPLPAGFIGENLTTHGIDLNALYPGDELCAADVVLRITKPRDPCTKLAARVGIRGFARRFGQMLRTGVYCSVVCEGTLRRGDTIEVVCGGRNGPSIRSIVAAKYRKNDA